MQALIGVVTVARSDYGIYLPILRAIQAEPSLRLGLYVAGAHLSPEFGLTVREIEKDGFDIVERVEMLLSSDSTEGISKAMGLGLIGFAQAFARTRPDLLLVLGDRFEMHAAALAALPFRIPIAHLHGGELTEGAIDDALRHSMTKLSHLHFVSTADYARRVIQLGEAPARVIVSGAPSLDQLRQTRLITRNEFAERFHIALPEVFLLVTYHPVTLEYEQTEWQIQQLLAALRQTGLPVLFTMPNADTNGRIIRDYIRQYVAAQADSPMPAYVVENLGTQGYASVMQMATAMVGNSSSGILEAPWFKLPVVNIGNRQRGRTRAANVIDVDYATDAILQGIQLALSADFRQRLPTLSHPFGDGYAAAKIVQGILAALSGPLAKQLVSKRFYDL